MTTSSTLAIGDVAWPEDFSGIVIAPSGDPAAPIAARLCADIRRLNPPGPLTIVAYGDWSEHLPAIALAQRAARRSIAAYVLVDPTWPTVSEAWPDARIHVIGTPGFDLGLARLRGWDITAAPDFASAITLALT